MNLVFFFCHAAVFARFSFCNVLCSFDVLVHFLLVSPTYNLLFSYYKNNTDGVYKIEYKECNKLYIKIPEKKKKFTTRNPFLANTPTVKYTKMTA